MKAKGGNWMRDTVVRKRKIIYSKCMGLNGKIEDDDKHRTIRIR